MRLHLDTRYISKRIHESKARFQCFKELVTVSSIEARNERLAALIDTSNKWLKGRL
jgi:hypothetical protein